MDILRCWFYAYIGAGCFVFYLTRFNVLNTGSFCFCKSSQTYQLLIRALLTIGLSCVVCVRVKERFTFKVWGKHYGIQIPEFLQDTSTEYCTFCMLKKSTLLSFCHKNIWPLWSKNDFGIMCICQIRLEAGILTERHKSGREAEISSVYLFMSCGVKEKRSLYGDLQRSDRR